MMHDSIGRSLLPKLNVLHGCLDPAGIPDTASRLLISCRCHYHLIPYHNSLTYKDRSYGHPLTRAYDQAVTVRGTKAGAFVGRAQTLNLVVPKGKKDLKREPPLPIPPRA